MITVTGLVFALTIVALQIASGQYSPRLAVSGSLALATAVAGAVQVGFERTMVQDVGFGIRRLVDIANKALSPAINDPYTGVQAVQHLSVLLCGLARLRLGDWTVRDAAGPPPSPPTWRRSPPRPPPPCACSGPTPPRPGRPRGRPSRRGGRRSRPATAR
jgi:Predicted membrane protein (DUF2254)